MCRSWRISGTHDMRVSILMVTDFLPQCHSFDVRLESAVYDLFGMKSRAQQLHSEPGCFLTCDHQRLSTGKLFTETVGSHDLNLAVGTCLSRSRQLLFACILAGVSWFQWSVSSVNSEKHEDFVMVDMVLDLVVVVESGRCVIRHIIWEYQHERFCVFSEITMACLV